MKFGGFVLFVIFGCFSRGRLDKPRDVDINTNLLASVYGLKHEPVGSFFMSAPHGDDECDHPLAQGYMLVLHNVHDHLTKFYRDRLYMWHKGKVEIHIIDEDGKVDKICLGDTLEEKKCKYAVVIPAGKVSGLHVKGSAIFSGIVLGGTNRDYNEITLDGYLHILQDYFSITDIWKSSIQRRSGISLDVSQN